jgi:methionyl-tRNA formyltransferase
LTSVAQSTEGVTYAKKILNDEAKINWNQNSSEILRQIHGLSPHPGAYTYFDDKRVKIFRSAIRQNEGNTDTSPGTIVFASSDELQVATKDGCLALLELQMEGKKRLATREFLSGVELKAGDKFRE